MRGGADQTLFVKHTGKAFTVAQIYVDNIVFGSTIQKYTNELIHIMKKEFEISMVGELTYFLGLQVKQCVEGYFITQKKNAKNLINRLDIM